MRKATDKKYIGSLVTMLVFGIFAACVVMVLLTGAGIYRRIAGRDAEASSERIISGYISTRVRGAESPQSVSVERIGGRDVLCIGETVNGREYVVYVYLGSDGVIRELYTAADAKFYEDSGEKLIEAEQLSFTLENGTLRTDFRVPGAETETLVLRLRGAETE